jgi:hypothetical protein
VVVEMEGAEGEETILAISTELEVQGELGE